LKQFRHQLFCFGATFTLVAALALPAVAASEPSAAAADKVATPAAEEEPKFRIFDIAVEGNTLLSPEEVRSVIEPFIGPGKTAADVETARDRLEQYYHEVGFPAVLVNIPEQSVHNGRFTLQAIESTVGRLTVTGNRWYSADLILNELPSLREGQAVYVPAIEADLGRLAGVPDLKVTPSMHPGSEAGTVDVALKVEDKMPLHGSLEINNRNSLNTSETRLNGMLRYDNLWQRLHSISAQFQTAPEEPSEVLVLSGSYLMPAPWANTHKLVAYGVYSDSDTGFGEGFKTIGEGYVAGFRYLLPLERVNSLNHNLTLGCDYKDFKESQTLETRVSYLPFMMGYNAGLPDGSGMTSFGANINVAFRGFVTKRDEFEQKRNRARGNYVYLTAALERSQKLPAGLGLYVKVDGQVSDQPLISNEQFVAGGMDTVRGYRESEASGDNGVHGTVELLGPDLGKLAGLAGRAAVMPYLFYEAASLAIKEPLPEQEDDFTIQSVGGGVRGLLFSHLDYQVDWAYALKDMKGSAENTRQGDSRVLFKVKYQF
jgi:hemolysin activation/secretion protein